MAVFPTHSPRDTHLHSSVHFLLPSLMRTHLDPLPWAIPDCWLSPPPCFVAPLVPNEHTAFQFAPRQHGRFTPYTTTPVSYILFPPVPPLPSQQATSLYKSSLIPPFTSLLTCFPSPFTTTPPLTRYFWRKTAFCHVFDRSFFLFFFLMPVLEDLFV